MTMPCRIFWLAAIWWVLPGCSSEQSSYTQGVQDAKVAIENDKIVLKEYPALPSPPGHSLYVQNLKAVGIGYQVPQLPPGVEHADFVEEVRGWNETMKLRIQEQFGKNALGEMRAQASKQWQAQLKAQAAKMTQEPE